MVAVLVLGACEGGSEVARTEQPNIFGDDDRTEVYAFDGPAIYRDIAEESVGAWILNDRLNTTNPTDIRVEAPGTHRTQHDLCAGERFEMQPSAASCTGVLIDDDLVATAGHCFDEASDCEERSFVFGWYYESDGVIPTITQDNVYGCQEVLVQRDDDTTMDDYAIIRLNRAVAPQYKPVAVRYQVDDIAVDTPVALIGHGAGLPMKIDDGARVLSFEGRFFETNVDAFGGSSGAPVVDATGTMLGIHVRGPTDYVDGPMGPMTCQVENRLPDDGSRDADETVVGIAVQALCALEDNDSALCNGTADDTICVQACDCPMGTSCDVVDGNITCSTSCSMDEQCAEGFSCEMGRCTPGLGCHGGDIWERDICSRPTRFVEACGADEVCSQGACVDAPPGDTCALAEDLIVTNRFIPVNIVDGSYRNLYQGSCGAFGPDRVWRLNVDRETRLEVSARHMGYRIHIREGDCEMPEAEIACSLDTNRPRLEVELTPGIYYVFLDAQQFTNMDTTVDFLFDVPDAGPPMGDAGMPTDAGPMMEDGGCGCRVGAPDRRNGAWAFGLVLLGLLWRRRR